MRTTATVLSAWRMAKAGPSWQKHAPPSSCWRKACHCNLHAQFSLVLNWTVPLFSQHSVSFLSIRALKLQLTTVCCCRTSILFNGNYAAELAFDDGDTYVLSMVVSRTPPLVALQLFSKRVWHVRCLSDLTSSDQVLLDWSKCKRYPACQTGTARSEFTFIL